MALIFKIWCRILRHTHSVVFEFFSVTRHCLYVWNTFGGTLVLWYMRQSVSQMEKPMHLMYKHHTKELLAIFQMWNVITPSSERHLHFPKRTSGNRNPLALLSQRCLNLHLFFLGKLRRFILLFKIHRPPSVQSFNEGSNKALFRKFSKRKHELVI